MNSFSTSLMLVIITTSKQKKITVISASFITSSSLNDFVSGFFAGCDAPATLAPARPGAAVISAFSANSFT
jgi:hypothetical protein